MGCCGSCGGQDADKANDQVKDEAQEQTPDQESNKAQEQTADKEQK
jgi:hypothetical protein